MPAPPKVRVKDVDGGALREPPLTDADVSDYLRGWNLFNRGEYWHAHEAWEAVWKRHPEPSRLFFEGIIQLAAAYHLLTVKRRHSGTMGNFSKAESKLRLFDGTFLGVDVRALLLSVGDARQEIERLGAGRLDEFPPALLPKVACALTPAA
jgi:predicted metal-dependent hydrolase